MSDDIEQTKQEPIRAAYGAAVQAVGREAANAICVQHGASAGMHPWRRVPDNQAKACIAALLAGNSRGATIAARGFEQVRRESFARIGSAEREAPTPKPPKRLDPVAIYERFNNPPPRAE